MEKIEPQTDILIPEKHTQLDLFICDVADAALKDIMQQMENPFYSLSKKPEMTVRRYEHNGQWMEIVPSHKGIATIYDKDILIYCISQIMHKVKAGEAVPNRVRLRTRDLLTFANRGTAGKDYQALCDALDRLAGTRIITNIKTGGQETNRNFSLIQERTIAREFGLDGRMLWAEVVLSDWVVKAVEAAEVLTLHRDYFRLRKPIERRIYEIARKHCGRQARWQIGTDTLLKKSGAKSNIREFRRLLGHLIEHDHLPDYRVSMEGDNVVFSNRATIPALQAKAAFPQIPALDLDTYAAAREVCPGWDVYQLEAEWREWATEAPRAPDAAFIGFCRKVFEKRGPP